MAGPAYTGTAHQLANSLVPCSSGLQFGSQYPCDPANEPMEIFDYLPESLLERTAGLGNCVKVMVLDKWLGNADGRQAIFTRRRRARKLRILFIDQGYCLTAGVGMVMTWRGCARSLKVFKSGETASER